MRLGKNGCKKKNVRKDVIEKLVAEKLFRCLQAPDVVNYIVEQALDYSRRELAQSDVSLLEQQLAQTETALKNLLSAIEQGIVTVTTRARLLELEKEQARLSAKLTGLTGLRGLIDRKAGFRFRRRESCRAGRGDRHRHKRL